MMHPVPTVCATIARCILGETATTNTRTTTSHTNTAHIGDIHLHPHQISAHRRIQRAVTEFGGALLCDEVGLGKTYVALAIATRYTRICVVAPATLHPMWREALSQTALSAELISFETLSRHPPSPSHRSYDIVIVDEAHHARTPSAKRYPALTQICQSAKVLLLSATPIHNTYADLITLLTLIVGDRAAALNDEEIGRIIIRRTQNTTGTTLAIPTTTPIAWTRLTLDTSILNAIQRLPPSIPPSRTTDTRLPHTLLVNSLIRQWTSSTAALRAALQRRLSRATAMLDALQQGRYPTEQELRLWTIGNDALQLAFPNLIPPTIADVAPLAHAVQAHADAVRTLHRQLIPDSLNEHYRARLIREIRRQHPGQRIVAFSQYTATIHALFRTLRNDGAVAALTASGGVVASGPMPREEIITHFAPSQSRYAARRTAQHAARAITLLLTTDLLSEGVNLQDASIVIHTDLPWTAAKLEQRVGRIARIGSTHESVTSYGFLPPESVEAILHSTSIIQTKTQLAHSAIGPPSIPAPIAAPEQTSASIPEHIESIHKTLRSWQSTSAPHLSNDTEPPCAMTVGTHATFLAACIVDTTPLLVVKRSDGTVSTAPSDVWHTINTLRLDASQYASASPDDIVRACRHAQDALERWFAQRRAATNAGVPNVVSSKRHLRTTRAILRRVAPLIATTSLVQRARVAPLLEDAYRSFTRRPPPIPPATVKLVALLLIAPPG